MNRFKLFSAVFLAATLATSIGFADIEKEGDSEGVGDGAVARAKACLDGIYGEVLGRAPDYPGADGWVSDLVRGASCGQIKARIEQSGEAMDRRRSQAEQQRQQEEQQRQEQRQEQTQSRSTAMSEADARACLTAIYNEELGKGLNDGAAVWLDQLINGPKKCADIRAEIRNHPDAVAYRKNKPTTPTTPTAPSNPGGELQARIEADARRCVKDAYVEFLEPRSGDDPGMEGFVRAIINGEYDCNEARARIRFSPEGNAVAARKEQDKKDEAFKAVAQEAVKCVNTAITEVFGSPRTLASFDDLVARIAYKQLTCGFNTNMAVRATPEAKQYFAQQAQENLEAAQKKRREEALTCVAEAEKNILMHALPTATATNLVNGYVQNKFTCPQIRAMVANIADQEKNPVVDNDTGDQGGGIAVSSARASSARILKSTASASKISTTAVRSSASAGSRVAIRSAAVAKKVAAPARSTATTKKKK